MCEACDATEREIERLKKWLKRTSTACGRIPRKGYFDSYYRENRERILAKAKQRNLSRRVARSATNQQAG